MAGLIDDSWSLSTADLIQQTAAFIWLNKGAEYKDLYQKITGSRIMYELYNRLTTDSDLETLKAQCIAGIVEYIKAHPKATEDELTKEITKHVKLFKERVEAL